MKKRMAPARRIWFFLSILVLAPTFAVAGGYFLECLRDALMAASDHLWGEAIVMLVGTAAFLLVFLLLALFFYLGYFAVFQPIYFSETGVRRGKMFMTWGEITQYGMEPSGFYYNLDRDYYVSDSQMKPQYIYLSVGEASPGLWSYMQPERICTEMLLLQKFPRLSALMNRLEDDGNPYILRRYKKDQTIRFYTKDIRLPEKMVWFRYDPQQFAECVRRIKAAQTDDAS